MHCGAVTKPQRSPGETNLEKVSHRTTRPVGARAREGRVEPTRRVGGAAGRGLWRLRRRAVSVHREVRGRQDAARARQRRRLVRRVSEGEEAVRVVFNDREPVRGARRVDGARGGHVEALARGVLVRGDGEERLGSVVGDRLVGDN